MVLAIHSNASYLNEENARSRAGGHHFLSKDVPFPPNNGAIHNVAKIIKTVMSSAAEAEWEHYILMQKEAWKKGKYLWRWVILSRQLQYKSII